MSDRQSILSYSRRNSSPSSSCSSSSFREDSDDSIKDKTYVPDAENNDDSDCDEKTSKSRNPKATVFNPLLRSSSIDKSSDSDFNGTTVGTSTKVFQPSTSLDFCAEQVVAGTSQSYETSFSNCNAGSSFSDTQGISVLTSPTRKGRKRRKNPENWKVNINKKNRNSGKAYQSHTVDKKIRVERQMKAPCGEKCTFKCSTKFSEDERKQVFSSFWELGDIEKQRQFIANCMQTIEPPYRYVRIGGTRAQRQNNNAYFFLQDNRRVRVCKLFFKNTLDINDRPIRTVLEKRYKVGNHVLEPDQRGKHNSHPVQDPRIREAIRQFIDTIPKIESHYTRAKTSKHYIEGSKSIANIHRDYVNICKEKNEPFANYTFFYRVFTQEFNISFFVPKKDLCEICTAYNNVEDNEKISMKEKYDLHQLEKNLSREEKRKDKEKTNTFVAVYDLQAVMQLPKGEVSAFYYKSKLNVYNFTIYDLKTNKCDCFVWDEANGHRGINELGTCVLQYLKNLSTTGDAEVIFYSDNCAGQQKNKYMIALYLYAVSHLGIKSITHKYLIKGHTQNEGDSAHSLIEREVKRMLKSGPIYTPESFVSIIRSAKKKGDPFRVNELCFENFLDLKELATNIGPLNISKLKLSEVKVLKVTQESQTSIFYKTSYSEEKFKEVTVTKRKKKDTDSIIKLNSAFRTKPGLPQRKKDDLLDLLNKNLIPKFYKTYYENL